MMKVGIDINGSMNVNARSMLMSCSSDGERLFFIILKQSSSVTIKMMCRELRTYLLGAFGICYRFGSVPDERLLLKVCYD